jgi:hypothetical protein
MTVSMWMIACWALLIPCVALAVGWLRVQRDIFLLLIYFQSLIYINVAPILAAPDVSTAMQGRYAWLQAWVLTLFQFPLIVVYCLTLHRRQRIYSVDRTFNVSTSRLALFGGACAMHGIAYFVVAAKYGLFYRRIAENLVTVQLSMNVIEFAIYRSFIELGPFLVAAQLLVLRTRPPMSHSMRALARAGFTITTMLFLAYAIVNTRLFVLVTIAMWIGVISVTRHGRSLGLTAIMAIGVAGVAALYAIRVVNSVRASFANGSSLLAIENFLPVGSGPDPKPDDQYRWRLNGIDLMAMIADGVESQGPALGAAWAVPLVLSLDPIVRTPFTLDAKRAGLTTAKTWLMLRYGGVVKEDYYSCVLTDAYGNFGVYGFLLSAVVLGGTLAFATAALRWSSAPAALLFGVFALTRILPFEQGLETVLFSWFKLAPFVIAFLIIYPLRRHVEAGALSFSPAV